MWRLKMLLVLIFLVLRLGSCQENFPLINEDGKSLALCVEHIINRYYSELSTLTYVNIKSNDDKIIKIINSINTISVLNKEPDYKCVQCYNEGYVVMATNAKAFVKEFKSLNTEVYWKPGHRFTIIMKILDSNALQEIFEVLVKYHVFNVIVVNGTESSEVYSYNPFENCACGRYFERVISYGQCLQSKVKNFFPNKAKNGFRNCTIRAMVPHIPPFSVNPKLIKTRKKAAQRWTGGEQYAFEIIGELEQFQVEYNYNDFAERVPTVDDNMRASDALKSLQDNRSEVVFGFLMLNQARASPFEYLYAHLAMTDSFITAVRRAREVPIWKTIYMEFSCMVWILLAVSFICCTALMMFVIRKEDKISIVLKMLDTLLSHGYHIRSKFTLRCILAVWIWFSYLMNSFYQSSLVSMTTNPSLEYQVKSNQDLMEFGYQPCICVAFRKYLDFVGSFKYNQDESKCRTLIESLRMVSTTDGIFNILPLTLFDFHKFKFYDSRGNLKMYHFDKDLSKVMYGMFLYKGFPLAEKWQTYMLFLRESGMIKRYFEMLYYEEEVLHVRVIDKSFRPRFIVPWYILVVGLSIATLVFMFEKFGKKIWRKVP